MFKVTKYILCICIISSLFGCASYGNKKLDEMDGTKLSNMLIEGKTKSSEIYDLLGDPDSKDISSATLNEKWIYEHSRVTMKAKTLLTGLLARSSDLYTKKLILVFNKDGVLTNKCLFDHHDEKSSGIFG